MDPTIKKILKLNRVEGIFHTHVSLIQPKGKFQFNRQTLEEFWEAYCNYIEKGVEDNIDCVVGIAEKPQQYLPILVDVDLCIRDNEEKLENDTLYSEEQLKFIVETYQSVLRKIVDNCTDEDLMCIVLEKDMYQITKNEITYFKNGFHLHFPNIFLNKIDQETQLIPRVKESVKDAKLFGNLGVEDSASVIDSQCCKVPWLLYGSRKEGDHHKPYVVTKVYDCHLNIISLEKAFKKYQIFDHREHLIDVKGRVAHYLPRILSIVPYGRTIKEIKQGIVSPIKEKLKKERKSSAQHNKLCLDDTLKVIKRLLPMLSEFRANERNEWLNIGWIIFNETDGHPDGLDLWCEFSSRCEDKYDENVCIHTWERMTKGDLTLGTLRHYASIDNPNEYKKFKDEQCKRHIVNSLEGSHNDVAKALFAEYADQFVCSSYSGKVWYQFKGHVWEQIDTGVFLREKISGNFVLKYYEAVQSIYEELKENHANQDKSKDAISNAKIKQIQKIIQSLKNSSYKNSVMAEACEVFYNPVFKEKLDADPYLIAFKNGVYDLKLNLFRPGRPEDFLSKNMPINYINFSEDDERVQEVHTFFEQVFPDKSVRKYFLDVSSDIFVGGNHEKIVVFWTGDGDNGKSVTQSLFEKMLGKLSIKLNTNIITGKKPSAGSTFAELARAGGGVRQAVMEEPDGDEAINVGVFKNLSGNDSFYARDLFEKGKDTKEIIPLFKLIFICLAEGTAVSLPSGISLSIEKLKNNQKLLGYCSTNKGIVNIGQQALLDKGLQNCITLTLQDGRKITCTPNHKFLSASGEWITAENIVTGETALKMALDNPKCDDIFTETKYQFAEYNLNDYSDNMKAMALSRLIGYVITDGSLNKTLYIGHKIDAQNILNDIELLSGKTPKIVQNHKVLQISLPEELTRLVSQFTEKQHGGKVNNKSSYPPFIFDPECPTYLIREFLGGCFGGDGIVPPILNKKSFGSLQFVASKIADHIESLVSDFTLISQLMKERFDIESIVTEPKVYEHNKMRVFLRISKHTSILKFAENIGFRYCCHKMYRMTAIVSALRYKDSIVQQNRDVIERAIYNYESSGMTRERGFNKAIAETKIVIDKDYMISYKCAAGHYMTPSINLEKFLDSTGLDKFLNQGKGKGQINYSVHKDEDVLPCYKMIVVAKEDAGPKPVYDIVAEEPYSNFIANGIVTHNCNKLPRIKYADKAVWNRVRVIPFESTFCRPEGSNPAPDSYEEQLRQKRFPMDKQFGKKIPSLLEPLAWVLLQHRQKLTTRVEPEKVRAATEIYRKQNDVYRQFIDESIMEDSSKYISLTELYSMFKDWFKDSLPNHTLPNKNEVEEYFVKLWGSTEPGKKWKGYRQRTIQDDVDDGNAVILSEDDLADYSSERQSNPMLR